MADSSESSPEITVWLDAARGGDREALDRVLGTLYQELHTLARRQLSGQQNNTLDPTSLVHESYLKLVGASNGARFEDRAHFFAYATSAMRSVVVDYVRLNLSDRQLAEVPGFLRWLESVAGNPTLLKAASHLLQEADFTILRDLILRKATVVVQDESGLDYAALDRDFDLRLYGRFTRPNPSFPQHFQASLGTSIQQRS